MIRAFHLALLVGLAVVVSTAAADEYKPLKIDKKWSGRTPTVNKKLMPAKGYITSEKAFADVWKAWMGKEKQPVVDFSKELVLVVCEPCSSVSVGAAVSPKGDLMLTGGGTDDIRDDCCFEIAVVPLEGVKTINGKAIEKD
jgi:hypothetical protein